VPAPDRLARDLRAMVADAVLFSGMVGLGETYLPAFVLAAGLGEVVAGLIATLPMLAGAGLQLVTPLGVRLLRSYRRWVVLCATLQALSFAPLVAGAFLGRIGLGAVAAAAVAYWAFGMATSPAWNAWATSLVPGAMRARFFARRSLAAQASLFLAVLAGGLALEGSRAASRELATFGALFLAAMALRFGSAFYLSRQSEEPGLATAHHGLSLRALRGRVRGRRVLVYVVLVYAATNVAAPFFTPYMLGPLELSYGRFMTLTAAAFAARVVVLPLLGALADRHGTQGVLWAGAAGVVPVPLLWLVSHDFRWLFVVQLLAGTAWACLEYATLLSFFERIEDEARTSVLTLFNLAQASAVALGALLGSQVFDALDRTPAAYAALFVLSSTGRLATLAVLRGAPAVAAHPTALELRTLAVRPSAGAIQRPILASMDEEPQEPAPDS
jgi:hypothetical protein